MSDDQTLAYPARRVAKIITKDRDLMREYKLGCRDGRVKAVMSEGQNYVAVRDSKICERLEAADAKLPRHSWDEERGELGPRKAP